MDNKLILIGIGVLVISSIDYSKFFKYEGISIKDIEGNMSYYLKLKNTLFNLPIGAVDFKLISEGETIARGKLISRNGWIYQGVNELLMSSLKTDIGSFGVVDLLRLPQNYKIEIIIDTLGLKTSFTV